MNLYLYLKIKPTYWLTSMNRFLSLLPSTHKGEGIMHETIKVKHNYHQVCKITLTVL